QQTHSVWLQLESVLRSSIGCGKLNGLHLGKENPLSAAHSQTKGSSTLSTEGCDGLVDRGDVLSVDAEQRIARLKSGSVRGPSGPQLADEHIVRSRCSRTWRRYGRAQPHSIAYEQRRGICVGERALNICNSQNGNGIIALRHNALQIAGKIEDPGSYRCRRERDRGLQLSAEEWTAVGIGEAAEYSRTDQRGTVHAVGDQQQPASLNGKRSREGRGTEVA